MKSLFFHAEKPAPRPVEIVYAGKLSDAKGVPWILRALSRIAKPDWHLHLVHVDEPLEADQPRFEADLKEALLRQIRSALDRPRIDLSGIADRKALFSWKGIFGKVQALYGVHAI